MFFALKRSTFRCAVRLFFVITSGLTGVPNERRFCACWGKVQPARDLLFGLFQRLFSRAPSKREFLVNNPSEASLYPYKPATLIVELAFQWRRKFP